MTEKEKLERKNARFREKQEKITKTLDLYIALRRKANVQSGSWKP